MPTTYSFVDTAGTVANPFSGAYIFQGQRGVKQITVTMATEKSVLDVSSDGAVMATFIPGDNGTVAIEMQQTSDFYKYVLAWYNLAKIAALGGDVSDWFAGAMTLRNIADGTSHLCTGMAPAKLPDKTYAAQGGYVTVNFTCCDIQSVTI